MRYNQYFKRKGYNNINIPSMITSLQKQENYTKLLDVQKTELSRIIKRYEANGLLTKPYNDYLVNLYNNTIINVSVKQQIIKKKVIEQPIHIGLQMLNQLNN